MAEISRKSGLNEFFPYAAWIMALMATAGSLFFSEVMELPPCILCWYQRIALFPLVLIIGVSIVLRDQITAPAAGPPGEAQHRHTSRHDHHGQRNAVELTQCGPCDGRVEALQTCYHVHRGLPVGFGLSLWQTTTL